ncbi:HK97 gp10 family phage protein [Microbacterium sp. 22303]|uniref:HK97 gp10 family phage protein n=1 Tax=Microbacterium sp. 22303 TaxID=3453905 RepID=UPI003F871210
MADGFVANDSFFETILRTPGVEALVDASAEGALAEAIAGAPVDTGAYRDGLHIGHVDARYRRVARVVGSDEKTMLIESKTGNLARSLKGAKR